MRTDHRWGESRLTLFYVLVLGMLVAAYRLMPYLVGPDFPFAWNLVPVGALSLFIGSRLRSLYAWLLPLGVMFASDLLISIPLWQMGYSPFSLVGTPLIYASYLIYFALGRLIREGELAPAVVGGAALLAGVQFFLITNLAVWLSENIYPWTLEGLGACYLAAVPFYRNTVAGDLIFSVLIFGGHAMLVWSLGRKEAPAALEHITERWQPRNDRQAITRRDEVRS